MRAVSLICWGRSRKTDSSACQPNFPHLCLPHKDFPQEKIRKVYDMIYDEGIWTCFHALHVNIFLHRHSSVSTKMDLGYLTRTSPFMLLLKKGFKCFKQAAGRQCLPPPLLNWSRRKLKFTFNLCIRYVWYLMKIPPCYIILLFPHCIYFGHVRAYGTSLIATKKHDRETR